MRATEASRSREPKAWWEVILLFHYFSSRGRAIALYSRGNRLSLFCHCETVLFTVEAISYLTFSCHCENRVFSFHGRGNLLSLFCHCETVPFTVEAISPFRTGAKTPFLTFPQKTKTKNIIAFILSF